jgi:hypothetical protein
MRTRCFSRVVMLSVLLVAAVNAATITGTVTNQSNGNIIAGATLILLSGVTPVDTVTTNVSGVYTFSNVVQGSYSIAVAATGYVPAVEPVTITGANQTLTRNIALVPVGQARYGAIGGTVTDNVTHTALSNVSVILRLGNRGGGGGGVTWLNIDTVYTLTNGWFNFDNLLVNTTQNPYSLVFSKLNYLPDTSVEILVDSAQTDTVNAALQPVTAILISGAENLMNPAITIAVSGQGDIAIRNAAGSGVFALYTANGRIMFRKNILAGQNTLAIPGLSKSAGSAMIAVLSGNGFRVVEKLAFCR